MEQLNLLHLEKIHKHSSRDHIKANFVKVWDSIHEVILEINSQKFLINISAWLQKIEHFEVIAVKWIVELWVKVMRLLKKVVSILYFEA